MPEQKSTQRLCPFCNDPHDSQGLFMHVRNSGDESHGEAGSVPDGFEVREQPIVGEDEETVEVEKLQEEPEAAPNRLLLCNWCGQEKKGKRGLSIHLSKSAGDEMHPEGASVNDENYTVIPADENYNPLVDEDTLEIIRQREVQDSEKAQEMKEFDVLTGTESTEQTDTMAEAQQRTEEVTDEELEQRLDEIYVPGEANKTEQVAAVLTQEPALYNRPEMVRDLVDCSRTTFYEGRKLYDANAQVPTSPQEEDQPAQEAQENGELARDAFEELKRVQGESVTINGVTMVPLAELEDARDRIRQLEEELDDRVGMYR